MTPADPVVSRFADGLLDQHRRLEESLRERNPDLEWQPAPGRNTIGMLLAHVAIVEAWWIEVAPRTLPSREAEDAAMRALLGVGLDDDGMPAPAGGGHPAALSGWTLARYVDLLARTRAITQPALANWRDADLDSEVRFRPGRTVTRGWILHHALEHLAQHAGQIGLLSALQPGKPAG